MGYRPNLGRGIWRTKCAVCGFMFNSNELKERWDGLMVCEQDWEPRNILDFFKVPPDYISVPWTYKESVDPTNYAAITSTDSPYTLISTIVQLDVNAAGGNIDITLPLANTYVFAQSQQLQIRRTDTSTNTVTVSRQGADLLDGGTSTTIPVNGIKIFNNDALSMWRTV